MLALLALAGAWQCLPYYASGCLAVLALLVLAGLGSACLAGASVCLAVLALLVLAGLGSACCAREHLWMLEWHGKLSENLAVTLD